MRVAFEPEPGCAVETTTHAVAALSDVDTNRIGICLDLAHLACAWEEPGPAVARLQQAGLPVVKVQVSAALEVADPKAAAPVLADYVEPRFLHQTRSAAGAAYDDLPEALAAGAQRPVAGALPRAAARRPASRRWPPPCPYCGHGLSALLGGATAVCDHFEVETYTWTVLPPLRRPRDDAELIRGIAAELSFTVGEFVQLGSEGVAVKPLVVLDVVGLDPASARPHAAAVGRAAPARPARPGAARGHLLGAGGHAHRRATVRPRHRRQRLVLPRAG